MLKLHPGPEAPCRARAFVRDYLLVLGFPESLDDAILIADELVTNACRSAPNGPVWLSLRNSNGNLIIEVQDCSPEPPIVQDLDPLSECGRGLYIVKTLAAEFGFDPISCGKIVWAILN